MNDAAGNARADALGACKDLIARHRWAAFGTMDGRGHPCVSWVAYAVQETGVILHLSRLADHTRNLDRSPIASLSVSDPDVSGTDPQCLARLSVEGRVSIIEMGSDGYCAAVRAYQTRLPDSLPRFDFGDFGLYRLFPCQVRYVGGFALAYTFDGSDILRA